MDNDFKHAIVYGASGIIGWAVVDQLLREYPYLGTFSKVTSVTNRPVGIEESFWPTPTSTQPELQLVSGVNLGEGDGSTLAASLQKSVKGIETVTHVYYLVFAAVGDDVEEVATNLRMFTNVIDAHQQLSPQLKFVAFAGGTRGYGIYAPGGTFTPPLREDMVDKLPADYEKTVVYPAYRKMLRSASEGKQWTWCEVCPDAIIGFTPNGSQFSLALHWAQYLSLYAYNQGIGPHTQGEVETRVEVPFPGNVKGETALFTPVSSKTLAQFMVYASLHPKACGGGQLFNVADQETPVTYGQLWSHLAKWFGLVGVSSAAASQTQGQALAAGELPQDSVNATPGEYVSLHNGVFSQHGLESAISKGVSAGNRQLDSVGYWLTFDRQLSLEKLKGAGFELNQDPIEAWLDTFQKFRKAGLII